MALTGRVPGKAVSRKATWLFTGAPNFDDALEKSLLSTLICACISKPITGCHGFSLTFNFADDQLKFNTHCLTLVGNRN